MFWNVFHSKGRPREVSGESINGLQVNIHEIF